MDASEVTQNLFDLHADAVYRYARFVLRNSSDAEDAVQEIFIKVLRSWDQFQGRSDPQTWLWAITRNHLYDMLRKKKLEKRLVLEQTAEVIQPADRSDVHDVEMEELVMGLKSSHRQVLIMRYMQDMNTEEIAAILGWSHAKVRTTLHRAIKTLRQQTRRTETKPSSPWKVGESLET